METRLLEINHDELKRQLDENSRQTADLRGKRDTMLHNFKNIEKEIKRLGMEYHPLLLPESQAHYDTDGQDNITEFEQLTTIDQAFGAIVYNTIKYRNRNKGQDELDMKKVDTFKAWHKLLSGLLLKGYERTHNLRDAMLNEYPAMKYSLMD